MRLEKPNFSILYEIESNSDRSLELQLPAGEGDDGEIDVVAVAKNRFGETKAAAKVRSRPKQFKAEDFDDIDSKMKDLEDQGDEAGRVAFAHSILSSAKVISFIHPFLHPIRNGENRRFRQTLFIGLVFTHNFFSYWMMMTLID